MQTSNNDILSMSYEQAFAELEEIVSGLEMDSKTLEQAISLFERGQALARYCAELLEKAELRVRQLSDRDAAHDAAQEETNGLDF